MTKNGSIIDYKYDSTGIRTQKNVGNKTINYTTIDGRITSQKTDEATTYFRYDGEDGLISLNYKGTEYFYVKNIQNDIIGIVDEHGNMVVEYEYDAWGKVLSVTGSMADTLGADNPMRYRSYYYDIETGFYYLQSRYYNPEWGRFLNADAILSTNGELLGTNLFIYCNNNPIMISDPTGYIAGVDDAVIIGAALLLLGGMAVVYIATTPTAQRGWDGLGRSIGKSWDSIKKGL